MSLSASNLRRAATIQEKIEDLQQELASLLGGGGKVAKTGRPGRPSKSASVDAEEGAAAKPGKRKSGISAAGRKRIAAAQKARWAKSKAEAAETAPEKKAK